MFRDPEATAEERHHRPFLLALAAPLAANESEDEDGRHAAPATADQAAPRPEDPDGPPARRDEDRDDDGGEARESAANQDEAEPEPAMPPAPDPVAPLTLLDQSVPVGTFDTLYWTPDQSFRSIATPVPVLVAHGTKPGPHLCLTAAVHGDELNGIEMVRRLMYELEPDELAGTVVGVPIVNLDGFRNGSRYLSDRRDLNRYFPGRKSGSAASRVAYSCSRTSCATATTWWTCTPAPRNASTSRSCAPTWRIPGWWPSPSTSAA